MSLLMIVPSRGRPQVMNDLLTCWRGTTSPWSTDLLIVLDNDDPMLDEYAEVFSHWRGFALPTVVERGPRLRLIGSLNEAAVRWATTHDAIGFMGDDHRPRTDGWDKRFVETIRQTPNGIVYGDDLIQHAALPTAVAMDSRIVKKLGFMAPPELVHLYADNFWRDLGLALGSLCYLPDVVMEHLHPIAHKSDWDATYIEANSHMGPDEEHYRRYKSSRFDLDVAVLLEDK